MTRELTFHYVPAGQIGYGRMGVKMAEEMRKVGVTVYDQLRERDLAPEARSNAVCWASVPAHMLSWREGQHTSFITMWEAQTLPATFRDNFHQIDRLIVPSMQNVELFSQFHDDVHYMPLGVDPDEWNYVEPPSTIPEFRFLISGVGERKGIDLAYNAFREVFRGFDNVKLVIKAAKGLTAFFGKDIEQVTGYLSPEDERGLYANCHAYIQPSRGEGFGLQPLQAIAMGRPTILTNAHGHASFAHLGIPISAKDSPAAMFLYGDAGLWWEPDYDEICEAMWDVYKNYDTHAQRAKVNSQIAVDTFNWKNTTATFLDIMDDQLDKPYTGSGELATPDHRLYRVIVTRDYSSDIAGRSLYFEAGKEYWESADVKRIMYDRKILDVACLDDHDHGLTEKQVDELGFYRAYKEFCPTCHQQMNSGVSKADLMEQLMIEAGL